MARIGLVKCNFKTLTFIKSVPPAIQSYKPPAEVIKLTPAVRFKIDCLVSNHVIIAPQVTTELIDLLVGLEEKKAISLLDKLESRKIREFDPCEFMRHQVRKELKQKLYGTQLLL